MASRSPVTDRTTPRPVWLFPVALILVVQGLAAVVLSVVELASTDLSRPVVGLGSGLVFLVWGVGLGFVAWFLRQARRWSRSAAVCAQLVHLPVAWSFTTGGSAMTNAVAALIAVPSLVVLVLVFLPSSTAAFNAAPLPLPPDED